MKYTACNMHAGNHLLVTANVENVPVKLETVKARFFVINQGNLY